MSTLSSSIEVEIQHPEEWKLSLRIENRCVRLIAYSDAIENSMISRGISLDAETDGYLHALENCIYDNPFFLSEFKQVRIALHSMRFLVVPEAIATDNGLAEMAFKAVYADATGDIIIDHLAGCNAAIVFEAPKGVLPFINRTFNNPPVRHHLSTVCEHFADKCASAGVGKTYLFLHDDSADVFIFKPGVGLTFANTFECRTANDAAYFILNAWKSYGLDVKNDELQIAGDKTLREQVAPTLRKYVTYVMPFIFPAAAMRMGQDAMKAPFDLILMSICE